jgi:Protein of unknown function (DUF3667)
MSPDPEPPELSSPPAPGVGPALAADQAAAHATEAHGHHGPFHPHCENCATKLAGPFCHQCGQHDFEFHRSFWHVFLEALENLFHFEGKFFRNIVTLLFRPGRLTADFNAGKRAAQMPPFRLYVFVSFLFFLLIFLGGDGDGTTTTSVNPHTGETVVTSTSIGDAWREVATSMKTEDWQDPAKVNAAVEQVAAKATGVTPEAAEPPAPPEPAVETAPAKPDPEVTGFLRYLEQQGRRLDDPAYRDRLVASIKSHLPHLLMFCLPLFALYTRVLFRKSGQVYLQHLVVAVHFHTFIYLWILFSRGWTALASLPGWSLDGWVGFACSLWLCLYPLLMLRRLYANSWGKTFVKTVLLAGIYATTLGLCFVAMAALIFLSA